MTLIAVWKQTDRIWVASDRGGSGAGIVVDVEKTWPIDKGKWKLVWGYAGPEMYGALLTVPDQADDWDSLRESVRSRTADINRRARAETAQAGITDSQQIRDRLITVLVAGYLDGDGRILETDTDGGADFARAPVAYIGSGLDGGYLASGLLAQLGIAPNDIHLLATVMRLVIHWKPALKLAEPIDYWNVTPKGVVRLDRSTLTGEPPSIIPRSQPESPAAP